jgi:hypothetical protein
MADDENNGYRDEMKGVHYNPDRMLTMIKSYASKVPTMLIVGRTWIIGGKTNCKLFPSVLVNSKH